MSREVLLETPSFPFHGAIFEVVVVRPSRAARRDISDAMPAMRDQDDVHCVVCLQKTSTELIDFSDTTESDKDTALLAFLAFAEELQRRAPSTAVVSWPDPASGLPMVGPHGSGVFCEIHALESHRIPGYTFTHVCGPAGGCRVLQHPRWGCAVYPSTVLVGALDGTALCDVVKSML